MWRYKGMIRQAVIVHKHSIKIEMDQGKSNTFWNVFDLRFFVNSGNQELKQRMEQLRLQREIVGVLISSFVWEIDARFAGILSVSADRRSIFLKEEDYLFRTFFGDVAFTEGIHYWEIVADARTEHELKIGVSMSKDCDQRTAFCDYNFGWAFFGVGQLRHNSNAQGASYGRVFKR